MKESSTTKAITSVIRGRKPPNQPVKKPPDAGRKPPPPPIPEKRKEK